MSFVSRDWACLNGRCRVTFHSYEPNPACPRCGCVRVSWVPGGGHVGSMKALDASLKSLAASYGMTDINSASPSRVNRAMPMAKHDPVVADGPVLTFAPGFAAPFHRGGRATCEPSRTGVNFTVRSAAEAKLPKQNNMPAIGADTWKGMRRAYKK